MGELRYWIDLAGIGLADQDSLTWLHAMPFGVKSHPEYGKLEFTPERLQRYADGVKNRVRQIDLDIDYAHKRDVAKGEKAAGWVKDAEVRSDGLWLGVQWTEPARQEIEAGEWRYFSPEFKDEWIDAEGVAHKDVVFGGGLTNRPFLKDLLPIAASEGVVDSLRPQTENDDEDIALLALTLLAKARGGMNGV